MYKAVFCDLDGTLFSKDGSITEENIKAISAITERGIHFVPCTGRVPYTAFERLKPLDFTGRHIVGCNGAVILEGDEYVKAEIFPYELKKFLIEFGIKKGSFMHIQTKDQLYFLNHHVLPEQISNYVGIDIDEKKARELINEDLYKIAYLNWDFEYLKKLKEEIEAQRDDMDIFLMNLFLEMNKKGQTKSQGVIDYCKIHNIPIEDTIGIGDSFNDLPMLETTGVSCAPNNARDDVKRKVDYVSFFTNDQSAVADVIRNFILMDEEF